MVTTNFWIALPDGWSRMTIDPEFLRRTQSLLATFATIHELRATAAQLTQVLDAAAIDLDSQAVLFAAQYVGNGDPNQPVHAGCFASIVALPPEADLLEDPTYDVTLVESRFGPPITRRTRFGEIDAMAGTDLNGTAQYFIAMPDLGTLLVLTFNSPTLTLWEELLEHFNAIAATVQFTEAA